MRWLAWILLFAAAPAHPQVTSAFLEYSHPHPTRFFINGAEVGNAESLHTHFEDYSFLSSADGGLPLELFRAGGNVLAVQQTCRGGSKDYGKMGASYRLTVYHSSGPPVVAMSLPADTRMLHLPPDASEPHHWAGPDFFDGLWARPAAARVDRGSHGWPELVHAPARGFFGRPKILPFLSHDVGGGAASGTRNLFRTAFQLPQDAPLPTEAPPFRFLALELAAVADNGGFSLPERALGPWLPERLLPAEHRRGISDTAYWDSATFPSGASCWYELSRPPAGSGQVLDVTFQAQILAQHSVVVERLHVERILFNYSVDGTLKGALPKPVNLSRNSGFYDASRAKWSNGYHHATADRSWTWEELSRLRVQFKAEQAGFPKRENRLLRAAALVRYIPKVP